MYFQVAAMVISISFLHVQLVSLKVEGMANNS